MKYAKEVEGKFKGIETFFIEDTELDFFIDKMDFLCQKYTKCRHVYICDTGDLIYDKLEILKDYFFITVETARLPRFISKSMYEYIHFMLRIEDTDFWNLKETDSIKFHSDDMYVKSISKENMFTTLPEAFDNDETIF